jgi:uncharacterized protein (DUF302 family)
MMKPHLRLILTICCLMGFSSVHAVITDELMMIRSDQAFPETMSSLQEAIKKQGYALSRVQRVDIGLTAMGFKTDKYRVVFFGKTNEIHHLSENYPSLIPYLPLKIAIFAEGEETLLVCSNPMSFIDLYPEPELADIFRQWRKDIEKILNYVQFSH